MRRRPTRSTPPRAAVECRQTAIRPWNWRIVVTVNARSQGATQLHAVQWRPDGALTASALSISFETMAPRRLRWLLLLLMLVSAAPAAVRAEYAEIAPAPVAVTVAPRRQARPQRERRVVTRP